MCHWLIHEKLQESGLSFHPQDGDPWTKCRRPSASACYYFVQYVHHSHFPLLGSLGDADATLAEMKRLKNAGGAGVTNVLRTRTLPIAQLYVDDNMTDAYEIQAVRRVSRAAATPQQTPNNVPQSPVDEAPASAIAGTQSRRRRRRRARRVIAIADTLTNIPAPSPTPIDTPQQSPVDESPVSADADHVSTPTVETSAVVRDEIAESQIRRQRRQRARRVIAVADTPNDVLAPSPTPIHTPQQSPVDESPASADADHVSTPTVETSAVVRDADAIPDTQSRRRSSRLTTTRSSRWGVDTKVAMEFDGDIFIGSVTRILPATEEGDVQL